MRKLLALLVLISCTACFKSYKKVDLKIKEVEPQKLVVVSFISPQDTSLLVYVSRTQSATSETSLPSNVPDATVSISNGNQSVLLTKLAVTTNSMNGYWYGNDVNRTYYSYRLNSSFKIQAGGTYTLTVQTPYGEFASATCTIPNVPNTSLTASKETKSAGYSDNSATTLTCKWQDHSAQLTYYALSAFGFRTDSTFRLNTNWLGEPYYDTVLTAYPFTYYINSETYRSASRFITNENKSEFTYILSSYYYPSSTYESDQYYYWNGKSYSYTIQKQGTGGSKVYLSTTDSHYYQYHTSLDNFIGDDFFSEPAKVYTNIENGYGVFAAKNSYILLMD